METTQNSRPAGGEPTPPKQGQYAPRRRKDTTPRVDPHLAIELVMQEMERVEGYTKRIEEAAARKVQLDRGSLENAENRLRNVLNDFERQGNKMKSGNYVNKQVSLYSILCAVFSLMFACLMCGLWVNACKERDRYKVYYEYYYDQKEQQENGEKK